MKMKIITVKAQSDEPPYDSRGNGMPITGIRPMVIPILMKRWVKMQLATQ